MAREFSVVVGINATRAVVGGRQFKTGADQVNRSNRGMQRSTAATTKRMTAMITTMGRFRGVASLMFAGFLGVGGIGSVIRTISSFQTKISQVTALIDAQNPRSLGGAMAALTERARELGATTLFTANQAAEGMRFLSLAGFDALEVYQAIQPALLLATVGMLDLGNAADIVSNIMAAFSIDAADTIDVVNALAFVSSRTNTNIQQLGEAMKFVGPVAGALGINVQETSVALGILGNSGLQASLAGTSLRRVMSGLLNPSKEAKKVFAAMGVTQEELVATMTGPEGLVNLVELLAAKGIDAADAFLLFGQRGAPGLLSLVNQRGKLRELTEGLEEMGDIAEKQAAIIADNLGGDAKIAISALNEVILAIGDSGFGDWLRDVTQSATGFFRALTDTTTPADEMTAAMQKGANAAEFLMNNVDNLKKLMFIFVAFLNRQMLVTMATLIGRFILLGTTVAGLAGPFAVASAGAKLFAGAMGLLKRALITTGVGALVVGIGYLLDWAFSSDEATASAEDLTEAMVDQRIEAEKLVFVFDLLDATDRTRAQAKTIKALETQTELLELAKTRMEGFSGVAAGFAMLQDSLTEAQNALNAEMEGTEAYETAAARLEIAKNAFVSFNAAMDDNGFPEAKEDVARLQEIVDMLTEDLAAMDLVTRGLAASMDDARDMINKVGDHAESAGPKIKELSKEMQDLITAGIELLDEADPLAVALNEVEDKMATLARLSALSAEELETLGFTTEDLVKIQNQLNHEMSEAEKTLNDVQKAEAKLLKDRQKQFDKLQDLRDGTGTVAALTREYTRELVLNSAAVAAGTLTAEEFWEMQKLLEAQLKKNVTELENNCKKTEDLKGCMDDNAKAMQGIWDQAMRNIQDSFADAFRNIGHGFDDFAKGILDAFKDLLANMAAQAAINNIFGGGGGFFNDFFGGLSGGGSGGGGMGGVFGRVVQGGGGSGGGASGGGLGGTGPLASVNGYIDSALSSLASMATAFAHGAGAFLSGAGGTGVLASNVAGGATTSAVSVFNTGAQNAAIANSGSFTAGGVAAGAGIGALTGIVADAILGGRGDPTRNAIFSAIGGAIGSIWGPIGSVVGGAIGSFVDNLFGGAKKLEKATLELSVSGDDIFAIQSEIISKQKSFFRGRSFKETRKNISASFSGIQATFSALVFTMEDLAEEFGLATDFIDDFEFARDVNIKGKGAEARIEKVIKDLFQAVTDAFLDDVEGLPERMKLTLDRFSGNLEEFIRALEATAGIERLFDIDLIEASSDAIEAAQTGIIESYQNALGVYHEVIEGYDGSIESLEELALATALFTQIQLDLITVYQELGATLSSMFQGSAQTIREALMSEEELYEFRRNKIDELVAQAALTTDPEELAVLAAEINRLGLANFNSLDADQQALLGPEFIEFFDGLDLLFGDQIAEGIAGVINDQAEADLAVAAKMEEAAQAILDAAAALEAEARRREEENEWRNEMNR